MSRATFVDLSSFNADPSQIDWQKYKQWSASADGISRVCLRSSYGNGYKDQHYQAYRAGAEAAGIDRLLHYHYCYPANNSPQAEANWMAQVVGAIRGGDLLMMDFEETGPLASAEWAYEWLVQQQQNYPNTQIIVYSFLSLILSRLQDSRLAQWPLIFAKWEYSPDETPACPAPWTSYSYLQYSDKATSIPGIPGTVDADVYITGENPMSKIPTGWKDDGTTLTAPNGVAVRNGFRQFILSQPWNPDDYPLGPEVAVAVFEMSNPGLGGGTQQLFRCSMLGWNAQLGVIHEWIGTELMAIRVALAAAQSALKDAQTQLTQCKTTLQVTGQQLQQATAALSASPAYGVACNAIADVLKSLPRYPGTSAGTLYHANEEAS